MIKEYLRRLILRGVNGMPTKRPPKKKSEGVEEQKPKSIEEKLAPDQPIVFSGKVPWSEVHSAYMTLLSQILNQSQIINYQYKRLLGVELFIKDLKNEFDFNDEELKMLEELMEDYGLDKELFTESECQVQ